LKDDSQTKAAGECLAALGKNALPPNPRRLKALANQWRRLAAAHWDPEKPAEELRDHAALLLVVAYVYQFHTAIWQLWRFDLEFWQVIEEWVSVAKPKKEDWLECFQPLALPPGAVREDQAAPTFVDPAQSNIFWIASLIRANGDLFNARRFAPYLEHA
jgi:hypothetical protein